MAARHSRSTAGDQSCHPWDGRVGQQNLVGRNDATFSLNARDLPGVGGEADNSGALEDLGTVRLGALAQGYRDIEGIDLAVRRYIERAKHVAGIDQRPAFGEFIGRHHERLDIHAARVIVGSLELLHPHVAERRADRAALFVAGALAGFLLQRPEESGRVLAEFRLGRTVAQLPDNAGRMPGRARCDFLTLDEDRFDPTLGQVVERRDAAHAAADDDQGYFFRQGVHGRPSIP